ncbi:hypothetical protein K1719_040997 [Acacia pycnantha]|nr:hypothetical protein K1719_040997 [Acacia pycnantha]
MFFCQIHASSSSLLRFKSVPSSLLRFRSGLLEWKNCRYCQGTTSLLFHGSEFSIISVISFVHAMLSSKCCRWMTTTLIDTTCFEGIDISKVQYDEVGDGTASVVVLAGELFESGA